MPDEKKPEKAASAPEAAADEANKPTVPIRRPAPQPDPDPNPDPGPDTGPDPGEETTTLLSGMPVAGKPPAPADGGETQRLTLPTEPPTEPPIEPPIEPPAEPEPPGTAADDGETRRLVPPPAAEGEAPVTAEDAGRDDAASLDPVNGRPDSGAAVVEQSARVPESAAEPDDQGEKTDKSKPPARRISSGAALIGVLLALFGFTLVVQLRSNSTNEGLSSARQEDLVRILSDLEARDSRLQAEIAALEASQRHLSSGVAGRQAARAEADKRAEELGLLAGTLPAHGPGLRITMTGVKASAVLNAVQELRGAGGEVMEIRGHDGPPVRIVASTYFLDAQDGGIAVDGIRLIGPFAVSVIGPAQTMETALRIPGGVVASVEGAGGSVNVDRRAVVEVTAVRKATTLQYARPAS
jgi:uncharacterized protein YlxW (UPF0749 family)